MICIGVATLAAGMPATVLAVEPKSWEFGGRGNWALASQPTTQAASNPTLDKVEQLLADKRSGAALDLILKWIKTPTNFAAPDRDRALYLLANAYFAEGDRIHAFYHLDELLDVYPESSLFYAALERQYQIADAYLNGYKRTLLGLPVLSATNEAIDMLYRIQERSPGSPLAEKALRRTADFYFADGQFDLAFDAYQAYARAYPRSPDLGRVRLRQALSSFAQFRGLRHDATPLIDARAQFEDIKSRYPELAQQEQVQNFINTINETLAEKLVVTADFYSRTGHPRAAAYTLLTLTATYPQTPQADRARKLLAALPARGGARGGQCAGVGAGDPADRPPQAAGPQAGERTAMTGRTLSWQLWHRSRGVRAAATAALLLLPTIGGCGYQSSGSAENKPAGYQWSSLYRQDVKTIAIPIFTNRTFYRDVEFDLSQAVASQVEAKSPYKIAPREHADTVLEGEVVSVRVRTVSNSAINSLPQEQLYVARVNFTWKDLRTGKILCERRNFEQTANQYPTLGEGRAVAEQDNVERMALAIVQELQAAW